MSDPTPYKNGWSRLSNIATVGAFVLSVIGVAAALILNYVNGRIAAIHEKFNEVETQFAWLCDAEAGERADAARLNQMLWKRVYGEELPPKDPYERGPAKHLNTKRE